jgi:hypothetical protein
MPTSMTPAASVHLVTHADYDSGWIGVTNSEGFRLQLEHNLRERPNQTYVMFSPNFEDTYLILDAAETVNSRRNVGVESDPQLITLWANVCEESQWVWGHLESEETDWNYGFIRVFAVIGTAPRSSPKQTRLTRRI